MIMKTSEVKVNQTYIYKGKNVTVLKRIKGRETSQRNMQSGELFTGFKRMQKKFELSNGEIVFAKHLE
jgi:hypothetical protein